MRILAAAFALLVLSGCADRARQQAKPRACRALSQLGGVPDFPASHGVTAFEKGRPAGVGWV